MRKGRDKQAMQGYLDSRPKLRGLPSCEVCRHIPRNRHFFYIERHHADEVHHIAKAGSVRWDEPCNLIAVCRAAHEFLERHVVAGRVLCLYVKMVNGELDLERLAEITRMNYPAVLEADYQVERCREFPYIEEMRLAIIDTTK